MYALIEQLPGGLFQLIRHPDGSLVISVISQWITDRIGFSQTQCRSDPQSLLTLLAEGELPEFLAAVQHASETLTPLQWDVRIRRDEATLWLRALVTPQRLANGQQAWNGHVTDISAVRLHESELIRRRAELEIVVDVRTDQIREHDERLKLFRLALDNVADGIYLVDRVSMRFADTNRAGHEMLGYSRGELLRMGPQDINPDLPRGALERRFDAILSRSDPEGLIETVHRHKNGERLTLELRVRPFDEGESPMLVVVAHNISARRTVEHALKASEQRLQEAQQLSKLGYWSWNLADGSLNWSAEIFRIFDRSPDTFFPTHERFLSFVHADDSIRLKNAETGALTASGNFDLEFRIVRPGQPTRWVRQVGFAVRDRNGTATQLSGTLQDISDLKHLEVRLARKKALLESLQAGLSAFVTTVEHNAAQPAQPNSTLTPDQEHHVEEIYGAAQRLSELISQVMKSGESP